jgi:hypothetical protein
VNICDIVKYDCTSEPTKQTNAEIKFVIAASVGRLESLQIFECEMFKI